MARKSTAAPKAKVSQRKIWPSTFAGPRASKECPVHIRPLVGGGCEVGLFLREVPAIPPRSPGRPDNASADLVGRMAAQIVKACGRPFS